MHSYWADNGFWTASRYTCWPTWFSLFPFNHSFWILGFIGTPAESKLVLLLVLIVFRIFQVAGKNTAHSTGTQSTNLYFLRCRSVLLNCFCIESRQWERFGLVIGEGFLDSGRANDDVVSSKVRMLLLSSAWGLLQEVLSSKSVLRKVLQSDVSDQDFGESTECHFVKFQMILYRVYSK